MKFRTNLPHTLLDFIREFKKNGWQCWLVGGAVRNLILGIAPGDFDFATDAPPETVMSLFKSVIPTGIQHGTVTVLWREYTFEVTTFRIDGDYQDNRHPESVAFTPDIREDLRRRDFTMNGLALDPIENTLLDPHDGILDIKKQIIRAIGEPKKRFDEDGLRPLRAIRFASTLNFSIEETTFKAISDALEKTASVSKERIRDEILKMSLADFPSRGFRLMEETGLLNLLLPELAACRNIEQKGFHKFDVLDHLFSTMDFSPKEMDLRLAALLHDIGKPSVKSVDDDGIVIFHRHEQEGVKIAEQMLKRLKLPNKQISSILHLIQNHMFFYEENWTDAAVRRFIARVGIDYLEPLLSLRYADASGMIGESAPVAALGNFRNRLQEIIHEQNAFSLKDLDINGNDLALLGCPKGKMMGILLNQLLETVLDDPSSNTKTQLSKIALHILDKL